MLSEQFAATVVNLLMTYLLHSTLLLSSVALAVWCYTPRSHALREWLWKSAAIIPLMSATLQLTTGVGNPVFSSVWTATVMESSVEFEPLPNGEVTADKASEPPGTDVCVEPVGDVAESGEEPAVVVVTALPPLTSRPIPARPDAAVVTEPAVEVITEQKDVRQSARDTVAMAPALEPVSAAAPLASKSESSSARRLITWAAWLAICVATGGLLRVILTSWLFHRSLRRYRVATDGPVYRELLRLLKREPSRPNVRLLESNELDEPISLGVWRPTIVVPREIDKRLTGDEIEALLAHELAHLMRGDTRWLVIGQLLRCCLPFQPLNLLACRRWRQAAEFQCDDWAAERTGKPLALARCLTSIVEWRLDGGFRRHVLNASGSQSTLSLRIERLVSENVTADRWNRARWRRALIVGALLVTAILCRHGPRSTLLAELGTPSQDPESEQRMTEAAELEADSLAEEFQLLNGEIQQLEAELRQVNAIVQEIRSSEEVGRVAQQLSVRLADLRRHRRELIGRANLVPPLIITE